MYASFPVRSRCCFDRHLGNFSLSSMVSTMPPRKGKAARISKTTNGPARSSSSSSYSASANQPAWLMKAEPDQRMEKGIDISFSVDKFAAMPNQTTPWDGVRNPEARTMMKEKMRKGDRVLFYHSNCKVPGIAGLAHVVKEGYPDYTAWDSKHPYFDPKTVKESPKWYMVDVKLDRKLPNLVPLALLQMLRDDRTRNLEYLTKEHVDAIGQMQLLNRGRLSVQHVEPAAYDAITLLGERGGAWLEWPGKWLAKAPKKRPAERTEAQGEEEKEVHSNISKRQRSTRSRK